MKKTTWRYTLCGSLTGVIPATVLLVVFGTVTVLLRKANNGAFFVTGALMLFVLAVIGYAFLAALFSSAVPCGRPSLSANDARKRQGICL